MRTIWHKARLITFGAIVAFSMILTGCSQKRNSLTVGFDCEFPPYTYTAEDGSYTGFDIELATAVCELEGWEIRLVPINWDEKDSLLQDGSIDCIWSGFTINGREADYTLSVPYCDNSYVFVVPYDSDVETLEDLAGKVVGVQTASSGVDYLTDNEEGKVLTGTFKLLSQFSTFSAAFDALEDGTLDAVVADIGIAKHYTADGDDRFRILKESLMEEQYGVALLKGNTELCGKLNADLMKLAEKGTLKELAEKYGIEDSICIESE